MENVPRISKWIGGGYVVLTAFIVTLLVGIALFTQSMNFYVEILQVIVCVVISAMLLFITFSIFRTSYRINGGILLSKSPFAVVNIKLKDIKTAERTMIPFSFKGFGASAYSGWFYIPTVGWTRVVITNLSDGVLIKAKDGRNYLITPSNPSAFIKSLKASAR